MNTPSPKLTPMMQQWHECKKQAKEALLFFRLGDFYEAFHEDAQIIARDLHLTLTKRHDIPMCGVPAHASEGYIDKLLVKGHKVAIAEQTEDPKEVKGIVKREVIRIVTPGTVVNSQLLQDKRNNYFVSLCQVGKTYGIAIMDLTTGEFRAIEVDLERELINELYRIRPSEVLISKKFHKQHLTLLEELKLSFSFVLSLKEEWHYDHQFACDSLSGHFKVSTLDGFGLKGMIGAINAAGALMTHVKEDLNLSLDHIQAIKSDKLSGYMAIDYTCMRNLELTESLTSTCTEHTLLHLLDQTQTPMGGRLFQKWLKHPLMEEKEINKRLDCVEEFLKTPDGFYELQKKLGTIKDLERLIMRISSGFASPRDLTALRFSLEKIPELKKVLKESFSSELVLEIQTLLIDTNEITSKIKTMLVDEPPLRITDGGTIRDGIDEKLDELREISSNSKKWIANYQNQLRDSLNIKTLRVGYTRAFGYYIEVSKGQSEKMPETFQRRQTLVNAERYISEELKEFEHKVLTSEERIRVIETRIYNDLKTQISTYAKVIFSIAQGVAQIDSLFSLAYAAKKNKYVRPKVDNSDLLQITKGRHPIIENSLPIGKFIPNNTHFDEEENRLFLLTGPNMAGKSTYIRQVALIVIMAQMGSYVPAEEAHVGIVDKVFSRIGASDDLSRGQSTFMVEMSETANILNNVTSRSLVILDEIGRGTSTYDGISIAWAVAEFLLTTENKKAKTLFATHYWELTEMENQIKGAVNLQVAVSETDEGIVFLHKIIKGGTDKSYGIHVAKLAGLPFRAIKKAEEMLLSLEKKANRKEPKRSKKAAGAQEKLSEQLSLFSTAILEKSPIEEEIKNLEIDKLTPLEALQKLFDLKKLLESKK